MRERSGGSCVFLLIATMSLLFFGATEALAGTAPDLGPDTIGCFDTNYGGSPSAVWYLRDANSTGDVSQWTAFGAPGTTLSPVVNAWLDDSNVTGLGLWDSSTGTFFVKDDPTTSGVADDSTVLPIEPSVSTTTDPIPLAGHFGGADVPGTGYYYPDVGVFVINTNPGNPTTVEPFLFGPVNAGDVYPVVGDWNGDGTDTVGVFVMSTGIWYQTDLLKGELVNGFQFGPPNSGWIPVAGDWDQLGGDSVGFYDPTTATFKLRNTNTAGNSDIQAALGAPGGSCQPVVGIWNITPP